MRVGTSSVKALFIFIVALGAIQQTPLLQLKGWLYGSRIKLQQS